MALALPGTREAEGRFAFFVRHGSKDRAFVWAWNERVEPKKPRVPRDDVVAVRVVDLQDKDALLASGEAALFTEPHYDGYRAVLVRLPLVGRRRLRELIEDAWRCQAPRALVQEFERARRR
ncbi:MAG TPA: hypothetical protein VGH10_12225 [Actinomycetota bacterium]|jgi:hypothetical protein